MRAFYLTYPEIVQTPSAQLSQASAYGFIAVNVLDKAFKGEFEITESVGRIVL